MNDVECIHNIPRIEEFLDLTFNLVLYEKGDEITIYEHWINDTTRIMIDFHSTNELIEPKDKLINIVTQDIDYLSWALIIGDDVIKSFHYRPLVDDSEKIFIQS